LYYLKAHFKTFNFTKFKDYRPFGCNTVQKGQAVLGYPDPEVEDTTIL
jgi:hypothetical protein